MQTSSDILKIPVAQRLQGVGEYYFSKKLREIDGLRAAGRRIINLGIGSPDLPPHPSVVEALHASALRPDAHGYQSYKGIPALREAFARWYADRYGVTVDPAAQVLPLIGSKEGLMHICMAYLSPGDRVLVPDPGYPTYRSAVTLAGGECVDYVLTEENGYQPDLPAIERDLDRVKIMILNYPHMPTGARPGETLFADLTAFARRHGILLVHDNPYSFIRNDRPQSLLAVPGALDVAVELNSLSKSHNMPGWRIGALFGAAERIEEVLRFKSNMDSGMFLGLQQAAVAALSLGDEWYAGLNELYASREALGYRVMELLGCKARPGQSGLFLWGELPAGCDDCYAFIDRILYDKGVFVTPGAIFGPHGMRYVRISLCANADTLQQVIDILEK